MTKPLVYDPDKVELLYNGRVIKGYNDESSINGGKIPLNMCLDLKGIGEVEGTVYLTKDQLEALEKQQQGEIE